MRYIVGLVSPLRNILFGAGAAIVIAFVLVVPRIGTVATWKIVLGMAGLALFVLAGRETVSSRTPSE